MADDPRTTLGEDGEVLAARYLEDHGYRIETRNWRPSGAGLRGEIDLVAVRGATLAVVEVKTRRSDAYGGPFAAVSVRKRRKLRALASAYLRERGGWPGPVRFDVIAVRVREGATPDVQHLLGAF